MRKKRKYQTGQFRGRDSGDQGYENIRGQRGIDHGAPGYQKGGKKGKKYYDERNARIREKIASGIDKVGEGFFGGVEKNLDRLDWNEKGQVTSPIIPSMVNVMGSMPSMIGGVGTSAASAIVRNIGKKKPMTKEERKEFNKSFRRQEGGVRQYQKGGEQKTTYTTKRSKRNKDGSIKSYKVVGRNLYKSDDIHSKSVEKKTRKGVTFKERSDTLAGGSSDEHTYGDKKLWKRRFKSKQDKEGTEKRRKEKIVYDEGHQMKKRKQRKIRFGKNKGKIKSKTVHWKDGKRTVTKRILDKTDVSKLQTGGFLEAPITRLFED